MSMILLKGRSLEIKNRIQPESMSLTLEERSSSANMTLGPDAPEISVGDWVKDETDPGKGIVWRVKTVDEAVDTQTRTVTLEHAIQVLKDIVLFGQAKPSTITGNKKDTACTAKQAAAWALSKQSDWKLGTVEVNPTNPYSFNGENIYAALETITSSLADVQWEYDMASYPFTLHIRKRPADVQGEMRMSRNITGLRRLIDRNRMYTRIYPIGKDNLHLKSEYLSKNEKTWGIVCKVETDQTMETEAQLKAWAQERLDRHCEPLVTVTVTGIDLSRDTGEALDKITLGRRCRVPLPDKGITITERVTKLNWSDKIKEPEKFTVTMANNTEDVASIVNKLQEAVSSGKGGGGPYGAQKDEEDHAWFVDTTEHVAMVAEAVAGEGASKDWSRVAEILVDGKGIHQRVTKTEGDMVTAQTKINANERKISLEATARENADTDLLGKIEVEAGRVSLVVSGTGKNAKINSASICIAINQDGSSKAVIEASKIHLLGETIAQTINAEYIGAQIAQLAEVSVKKLTSARGGIAVNSVKTSSFYQGDVECYVPHAITSLRITSSGNTYTLQRKWFSNDSWVDVGSFSRAVASWSMGWSGGKFSVKANPQDQSVWTEITQGTASWSGGTATIPILGTDSDNPNYSYATGRNVVITNSWSYQNSISTSSSEPGDYAKMYNMSKGYKYGYFNVTVNGQAKRIVIHLTD